MIRKHHPARVRAYLEERRPQPATMEEITSDLGLTTHQARVALQALGQTGAAYRGFGPGRRAHYYAERPQPRRRPTKRRWPIRLPKPPPPDAPADYRVVRLLAAYHPLPLTTADLAEELELHPHRIRNAVRALARAAVVERRPAGITLTEAPS